MLATPELIGSQQPTHLVTAPDVDYSDLDAIFDIARMIGVMPDPWQFDFLEHGLGRRRLADGTSKWAAYEVGLELSRQNGKSVIFELRALAGLFIFRERQIVYTAHKGQTAMNAYKRMVSFVEGSKELKAEVAATPRANGKEAIILHTGAEIIFRTRTAGGGRGLSPDCLIVDEVQDANDDHLAALLPAMSARTITHDPQIWYGGSAGTRKSTVLGRLVKRSDAELARREKDEPPRERRLVMARWAADLEVDDPGDERVWAKTNPTYGIRISRDAIDTEYVAMGAALDPTRFAAERLGVGDYPREEGEDWAIPRRRWEDAEDEDSKIVGPVMFAIEVPLRRGAASISAAGFRSDGRKHIECVAEEVGVSWAITELKRLTTSHDNLGVAIDPGGPANSLIGPLRDAGIPLVLLKVSDVTAGWGKFYDAFATDEPGILHGGGLVLTTALAAAETRAVQGATTWKRTMGDNSAAVIAATWAAHCLDTVRKAQAAAPSRQARRGQPEDLRPGLGAQPRRYRPGGGFNPRTSGF